MPGKQDDEDLKKQIADAEAVSEKLAAMVDSTDGWNDVDSDAASEFINAHESKQ